MAKFSTASDVKRLWPEPGREPAGFNPVLTVVFFHGLQIRGGTDAWRTTWSKRDDPNVCWPARWLPRDLDETKVVILSLSYDSDAIRWHGRGNTESVDVIGKNLIEGLVTEATWMNAPNHAIVLVGHSFGGLVIKSLVVEAKRRADLEEWAVRDDLMGATRAASKLFLSNLKATIFYGTPHSGSDCASYAEAAMNFVALRRFLAGIISNLLPFQEDMEALSVDFDNAAARTVIKYAFGEGCRTSIAGRPIMVVPYA